MTVQPPGRFVAYLRVSTDGQGRSGLGREAQRQAVAAHVAQAGGEVVAEFHEVESGKRADRPQLAAALPACRTSGPCWSSPSSIGWRPTRASCCLWWRAAARLGVR